MRTPEEIADSKIELHPDTDTATIRVDDRTFSGIPTEHAEILRLAVVAAIKDDRAQHGYTGHSIELIETANGPTAIHRHDDEASGFIALAGLIAQDWKDSQPDLPEPTHPVEATPPDSEPRFVYFSNIDDPDYDPDDLCICITPKSYWDACGYLDDSGEEIPEVDALLTPLGIDRVAESTYAGINPPNDIRAGLAALEKDPRFELVVPKNF